MMPLYLSRCNGIIKHQFLVVFLVALLVSMMQSDYLVLFLSG